MICFLSMSVCGFSEDIPYKKSIGIDVQLSMVDYLNYGLSYQQWFNNGLGFQTTLASWFEESSSLGVLACADIQKQFVKNTFLNNKITTILFGWASLGVAFQKYKSSHMDFEIMETVTDDFFTTSLVYGFSVGFGIEAIFSDHISIPLRIGSTASVSEEFQAGFSFALGYKYRF